jgi:hypothetical protein
MRMSSQSAAEFMRPSIYRQHTALVYAVAGPRDGVHQDGSTGPQGSDDFARQRKASPIVFLLPNTQRWLDALPFGVQPRALCKFYPRVANLIVAMWADTEGLKAYFDELLVDRRRGRKGFPREVANDLRTLRDYRAGLESS